ncbi:c-type cytochrome [Sedimenticola selenatireducens]|nr:cytochrome c [Sedimenticola selenatireducens]
MGKILIVLLLLILSFTVNAQQEKNMILAATATGMPGHQMGNSTEKLDLKTPRVHFKYGLGMNRFRTLCSSCHGKWGDGTEQGPPLLHSFYKPTHHSDEAFYRAAREGVRAHHWKFGDMPQVEGATRKDVDKIIPFIRWLQKENGIY